MVVIYENNHEHKPIDIKLSHFQDTQCGMTLTKLEDSVQAISPDGKTWFLMIWVVLLYGLKILLFKKKRIVWHIRDTKEVY